MYAHKYFAIGPFYKVIQSNNVGVSRELPCCIVFLENYCQLHWVSHVKDRWYLWEFFKFHHRLSQLPVVK